MPPHDVLRHHHNSHSWRHIRHRSTIRPPLPCPSEEGDYHGPLRRLSCVFIIRAPSNRLLPQVGHHQLSGPLLPRKQDTDGTYEHQQRPHRFRIREHVNFLGPTSSTEAEIIAWYDTNVTAQMLLTRAFISHLNSVAASGKPASFLLTGSGLGFVPVGAFSVYCATKAAVHSLALAVRHQIN